MDRNHERQRSRARNTSLPQLTNEEKFPLPPRAPHRDYPPCAISGNPIDNIFTAIAQRETQAPANFEAVVDHIRNAENISEDEQLIYVGAGAFGVYGEVEESGRKHLALKRKIVYEDGNKKPEWRRELSPGISRDYIPTPRPISELYSSEEERAFPKIGASSAFYMPRNS